LDREVLRHIELVNMSWHMMLYRVLRRVHLALCLFNTDPRQNLKYYSVTNENSNAPFHTMRNLNSYHKNKVL